MRTIVVIPAHNEEQNIEKVIKEIQTDLKDADILFINDASTDKTKEVIEKNNIKCISLLYNMGYSLAVQTGIKYAFYNNYDYCIQMDADGQHIAIEAKKLLDKMIEENVDIVIGSRFMEKTGYKHSAMRKLGTKIMSTLIKITCHKKITDPTSGFQCINRKTMERFSKMGNYPEFPDANLIIELLLDKYKIVEVPAKMREREFGVSMHKGFIKPIKYMIKVIYTIIVILLRRLIKGAGK